MPGIPLVDRPPGAVLFHRCGGAVTAAGFLADVQRVAALLPDCAHAINLCRDRYAFAVAFAACLVRGQVSLLTSDCRPARMEALQERYPGAQVISDDTLGPLPGAGSGPNPSIACDQLAAIVFTSGSTGAPVGHSKRWGTLVGRSQDAGQQFGWSGDHPAAIAGTVPPNHMYGFETTVLLPLHAPAATWCGPAFFPADVAGALAALPAPRVLVTTPHQLRALLQAAVVLPPLAAAISATAPLDPAQASAAEQAWGAPVHEIFGATELGSIASRRTTAGDAWTLYPRTRMELSEGTVWVGTGGDRAVLDDRVDLLDDRRFVLLGRPSDMVKLAGRRASLAGLTHALNQVDGVRDGVFVAPADLGAPGARMLAFAVAPGCGADTILAALRAAIDPAFLPRRVVLVDRLPRNAVGKLPHDALAALVP